MRLRLYLWIFLSPLPVFFCLYLSGLYLERVFREDLPIHDVVGYQIAEASERNRTCLFYSGLHNYSFDHKMELYAQWRPEVLVLGSSRVLQLRAEFFSGSMVNAGRSMPSIYHGYHFLAGALEIAPPRILLLGIDPWWFNPAFQKPVIPIEQPGRFTEKQPNPALKLIFNALKGKLGLADIAHARQRCHIGASAIRRNAGFDAFGSYWYTDVITGQTPSNDPAFTDTLDRMAKGNRRFEYGAAVPEAHFENLRKMIDLAERAGVEVRLFLPPFAPSVARRFDEMGERYAYFVGLRQRLVEDFGAVDFTDPASLGVNACEFIDGFHAGPVVYARLLRELAKESGSLEALIATDRLHEISAMEGQVSVSLERVTALPRTDFLNLGCESPR